MRVNERRENLQLSHIYTETIIKKFLYKKYYKRNISLWEIYESVNKIIIRA